MLFNMNKHGYSLVEVIVSITIIGILGTISVTSFGNFLKRDNLSSNAVALASALRDARTRTLASIKGLQYGVKIDADRFTVFPGPTFSTSTADAPFLFSNAVWAGNSLTSVLFTRVTGNSSASGTIDIYLRTDPSVKKSVQIEGTGLVNII
jgi:prepilin-type N-terminal cleavage/methylation domain-containing protein